MKRITPLMCAALLLVVAASSNAQLTPPDENHWIVWDAVPDFVRPTATVVLVDQFNDPRTVAVDSLDRLANPAEKQHNGQMFPPPDPDVHLTWWHIDSPEPERTVRVLDQFGDSFWVIKDAVYLVAPALKDLQMQIPAGAVPPPYNHFKCYEAITAPDPDTQVALFDQFPPAIGTDVGPGRLFCNPVQKQHNGVVSDIEDPTHHLACYEILNTTRDVHPWVTDQFAENANLGPFVSCFLCAPALKLAVVGLEESPWSGVKQLYR